MKRELGFSMIEAILAIVILASSFLGISYVLSNTTIFNIDLDRSTTAILLARGKMEEIKARSFDDINSIATTNFGGTFAEYNYSVNVAYVDGSDLNTAAPGTTIYKRIIVSVGASSWPGDIKLHNIKADSE